MTLKSKVAGVSSLQAGNKLIMPWWRNAQHSSVWGCDCTQRAYYAHTLFTSPSASCSHQHAYMYTRHQQSSCSGTQPPSLHFHSSCTIHACAQTHKRLTPSTHTMDALQPSEVIEWGSRWEGFIEAAGGRACLLFLVIQASTPGVSLRTTA